MFMKTNERLNNIVRKIMIEVNDLEAYSLQTGAHGMEKIYRSVGRWP